MMSLIQSIPRVSPTPSALAISEPTRAATMPIAIVSQMDMSCPPGTTSRPSAPMMSPTTMALMMSPRTLSPSDGVDRSGVPMPAPSNPLQPDMAIFGFGADACGYPEGVHPFNEQGQDLALWCQPGLETRSSSSGPPPAAPPGPFRPATLGRSEERRGGKEG